MINLKSSTPLVESVLKLEHHLSEIVRLGGKIEESDLKTDFDFEQVQKLMTKFTQHGEGVAEEIAHFSALLGEARAKAEAAAQLVANRADIVQTRHDFRQQKLQDFRSLGEKVRTLSLSLQDLKPSDDSALSDQDRVQISMRLSEFQLQLEPLVQEAERIRTEAREAKLKNLEQDADSLMQQLAAVRKKLHSFQGNEGKNLQ